MGWMSWLIAGAGAAGAAAANEIIVNGAKKHIQEPYEARKKAKEELGEETEVNVEEAIPEVEEPAPKKSRKKKEA